MSFLEDDIDPYEWSHTLLTIDMCALPPQTQFCDEYGYDIVPVRVISVAYTRTKGHIKDLPFKISLTVIDQQCRHMVNALVDHDVSLNVLSWEMWNALGQPTLSPTNLGFINFSQAEIACLGCICLKLCIQGELIYTLFYVANKSELLESVILGRTWMRSTKCQLRPGELHLYH